MTELSALLSQIENMGVDDLRAVWRERLGDPPPVRSGDVLRRALAEQLQEAAFGRERILDRRLGQLTARHRPGRKPRHETRSFKSGSHLIRDWKGVRHQVEVTADGFTWNGSAYDSLSKIAREITGVRWNGPRFFGLREGTKP